MNRINYKFHCPLSSAKTQNMQWIEPFFKFWFVLKGCGGWNQNVIGPTHNIALDGDTFGKIGSLGAIQAQCHRQ
jgi:hypothetical protein